MANITILELRPIETEFEELSDLEMESLVGGTGPRSVIRIDTDGDGRWDDKYVYRGGKLVRSRHR